MIILSGGTGTPKLLAGMREVLPEEEITVIVNTAEDTWVSGNLVCPDVDTVIYLFAGLIDSEKWWGVRDDTFATNDALHRIGQSEIMRIGDRDRATHILRSDNIRGGQTLTDATIDLTRRLGIRATILPMTDCAVATRIETAEGEMHFQEFWLTRRGKPDVLGLRIEGIENATPSDAVLSAFENDDRVVIGPSNPITSIGPILGVRGMRKILRKKEVVAISPIIGSAPVSGPAGKLMRACGHPVSSAGVLECYSGIPDVFVIDQEDVDIAGDGGRGDAGGESGEDGRVGTGGESGRVGGAKIVRADTMMTSLEKSVALSRWLLGCFEAV